MNDQKPVGLYIYKKSTQDMKVLKDMLQFLKTVSKGKIQTFSYIEAVTSLHPHLSLWENLQIETGGSSWDEFTMGLNSEERALVNLIKNPALSCHEAQDWEKFVVSLLKGLVAPSQNLLIDMNEEVLSPFMIQTLKKTFIAATSKKTVYLASARSSFWLDCAHTIVDRHDFKFLIETLDIETIKKHWAA